MCNILFKGNNVFIVYFSKLMRYVEVKKRVLFFIVMNERILFRDDFFKEIMLF